MAKVKLVKRGKPGPAGGSKKWYGLSVSGRPLDVRQMARQATRNTSLHIIIIGSPSNSAAKNSV